MVLDRRLELLEERTVNKQLPDKVVEFVEVGFTGAEVPFMRLTIPGDPRKKSTVEAI